MMPRFLTGPKGLCATLLVLTAIPVLMAIVRVWQIPAGQLPEDSLRVAVAPLSFWFHALGGALFGILGPVQFMGVLKRRFGMAHRVTGRIFVVAGLGLGLSGLSLLFQIDSMATSLLDGARLLASAALILSLVLSLQAARRRDLVPHRAWMIRAYAIGMGSGAVAVVMFPIYILTGQAPMGLAADAFFVVSWAITIAIAEWVIRRRPLASPTLPAVAA